MASLSVKLTSVMSTKKEVTVHFRSGGGDDPTAIGEISEVGSDFISLRVNNANSFVTYVIPFTAINYVDTH